MHDFSFLRDLAVIFGSAVAVAIGSRWLRLPSLAAFLVTGALIGPSGLSLVHDPELVKVLAEVGVMALLFTIGLEFAPQRLQALGRIFLVGGSVQAGSTILLGGAAGLALGYDLGNALFLGFLVTLSSTAIVLKLYGERRELETPQGRAAVGILLFQDLLVVPMIVATPVLGSAETGSLAALGTRLALGVAVLGAVFVLGRYVLPTALRQIVDTRYREILLLGGIALGLGLGLLTAQLGFSLALGAFLAGVLLAESEFGWQLVADVGPLRDVFNSLFFVSAGMLLEVRFVLDNPMLVVGVSAAIIVIKTLTGTLAVRALAYPHRVSLVAGASLAQVGEFSFLLMTVGVASGLLDAQAYQIFLAAAVTTMLATPLLVQFVPRLAWRLPAPGLDAQVAESGTGKRGHVLVAGYGMAGRKTCEVLRAAGIDYCVVELNGRSVREARGRGEPILYGDITRQEILEHAGVFHARLAVFAISDAAAVLRAVRHSRALSPGLRIIARAGLVAEIDDLSAAGADDVVAEEYEATIEIATRVLDAYGVPDNVIAAEARLFRGERYQMLRSRDEGDFSAGIESLLAEGTVVVHQVLAGSVAADATIRALAVRARSGATIVAVVRAAATITNPSPDETLQRGDRLVLVGSHSEITAAADLLDTDGRRALDS